MISNRDFLNIVKKSFAEYLDVGTSRSTKKLKPLHGGIAKDLANELGAEYKIVSQGYDGGDKRKTDREETVEGRYYKKDVDITVLRGNQPVAGYGVKFIMSNYKQNSNNYFENMLGETANLRANSFSYFQIYIIFDKLPYYNKNGVISRYEYINKDNMMKYITLSEDDPRSYVHTPDKTLICIINLKSPDNLSFTSEGMYNDYYKEHIEDADLMKFSDAVKDDFKDGVILNNYEDFIRRSCSLIIGGTKS